MRPILMIENVKNLHDARYCAAVGIAMATFELDPEKSEALTPAAMSEISTWLSGIDCVGRFSRIDPVLLNEQAEVAQIAWVQIPLEDDFTWVEAIARPLILGVEDLAAGWLSMQVAHQRFPDALFLVDAPLSGSVSPLFDEPTLLSRCILRYHAPDQIYRQLRGQGHQPFGFSLGNFSSDNDGLIDYDACDAFIDQYQELALA